MPDQSKRRLTHLLDIAVSIWRPTQIIVVRLTLLLLLISSLIPKIGSLVLENDRITTPIVIFIALLAFEILIHSTRPSDATTQQKVIQTRELTDELRQAFSAREVRLDIFCYSAETFFSLLVPFFWELHKTPMQRMYIRILVRNYAKDFIIPCANDGTQDLEYAHDISHRNANIIAEFYSNIDRLREQLPEINIDFEIRMYPFEPLHKGIIINRNKLYWAMYPIVRADRMLGGKKKKMWDYEGHSAKLVELINNGGPASAEMFRSVSTWFDTVWEHFSIATQGDAPN